MYVIVRIDCWGSAYHKHMRNYFFQALAPKLLLLFIAFIVAAVLTPPDPVSQIGLAVPTILLYEISIWSARMVERNRERDRLAREKKEAEDEAAEKAAKAAAADSETASS